MSDACPCGTGLDFSACCGRFHAGVEAPTAEALMRSRYAAFVRGNAAYLARTSHPMQRAKLDPRALRDSFALDWLGLEILATGAGQTGDREGMVHFRARYRGSDGVERVHDEKSRFCRDRDGAWIYRDNKG